jgi:CBS domain-containing protein
MSRNPITIDPQAPLGTALAVMRERQIRHLPVVDDVGRFIGMLTDRDIRGVVLAPVVAEYVSPETAGRLRTLETALEVVLVRDVMTWDALTIEPDAPLARAAAIMFEARAGSLGVVEGGRLVGIVTERDVLKALAATLPAVRGLDPDTYLW